MPDPSLAPSKSQEKIASPLSPEVFSHIGVWATQVLVADLNKEVKSRIEEGDYKKLASPATTRGVLLEDGDGTRIFFFPKELAPGEPDEIQLFHSRVPLAQANVELTQIGFSCGAINETCPWGPYFEVRTSKGEMSYVYNLVDAYLPPDIR